MGCQFTKTIRDERVGVTAAGQADRLAINRAAWPSGPLLARAVVSDRFGPVVIHDPVTDSKPQPGADGN